MALRKYVPLGNAPSGGMKPLNLSGKAHENAPVVDPETSQTMEPDVEIDVREVYFLIMHFLSAGPCHKTCGQFWNELLEHQLLPRRYHAWYSRSGVRSGDEDDDGISFPLNYNSLAERYHHIEKNHLVKLLKQLLLNSASPSFGLNGGNALNAAAGPTLLGTGSFSLLSHKEKNKAKRPPAHLRWPHMHADQVRGLSLREIGGGFTRHHRAPSSRAACYAIAKPSTMVQKMQNIKRLRGHRNAVYCAIFDCSGRYVVTGSDDRLVKIWSMETAFCLASCRGHEGDITDLAVSSNNALVASASNDCVIRVWRLPDGLPISILRGHTAAVTAIAYSPRPGSAYQLLSSSDDGTCRIWDARNSNFIPRVYVPRPSDSLAGRNNGPSTSSSGQSHQIFCCAFNASGTVFVTGSSDNLARVWNACKPNPGDSDQPNHEIDVLSGHGNDVNYVQFSGCAIASRFSLTDSPKEENIPKFRNSWFSHDNIVTCSRDGSAIIWIPKSRRSHGKVGRWTRAYHLKVPPPPMPPQPPRGGPRQRILPTPRGVNMIVWSLDNRFVLAAIMDCRICVWNAADGSLVHSLTGHTESTYVLDVHPFNPRIAMSAGYDGRTIVWDIWEGVPIRVYEISRFKLVDGKFSPDGTSIILSDDVGQLYILNTGQGESQKDAKYDQFFLGDYRPLIQDTYGNVLDQETQIIPYRRNMQDLLCDSGMIPYSEDYQIMYQKRRLGALGMEWKPPSIRFAVGPDFNLDPDYQMLPLADLDVVVELLPEFIDNMDWEPEILVQSDDNDSEYNVTEEDSSGGELGSLGSSSSGDPDCSAEDSEVEGNDGFRRSKRKKHKAEVEFLTSSGRRVKRRNLDECDGNPLRSDRVRKSRMGRKASKKISLTLKALRPQRAAARNALTLFTKITGSVTDGEDEDEDDSEGDLSESEAIMQDSNIESAESDRSLQNERNRHSKGKEVSREEYEGFVGSRDLPGGHVNVENRRRLVLKLPVRNSNKISLLESTKNRYEEKVSLDDSSFNSPKDAAEFNGINISPLNPEFYSGDGNWWTMEGHNNGDIKWGGVKARTSKHQRVRELMSSGAHTRDGECFAGHGEESNLNRHSKTSNDHCSVSHGSEFENSANKMGEDAQFNTKGIGADNSHVVVDMVNGVEQPDFDVCMGADEIQKGAHLADGNDNPPEFEENLPPISTKLRIRSKKISRDSLENLENGACDLSSDCPADRKLNLVSREDEHDSTYYVSPNSRGNGLHKSESQIDGISRPALDESTELHPKKMYNVVYRRSKSSKNRAGSECDGSVKESTSYSNNHDLNANVNFHKDTTDGFHKTSSGALRTVNEPNIMSEDVKLGEGHELEDMHENARNDSINLPQLSCKEWGSSSKMMVGLRSTRNRRTSYHFLENSPEDRRRLHQLPKGGWLMLSRHEGSRYIPQLGDKVVYLRQGHQEYIDESSSREVGPWKVYEGNIRAVEFCEVVDLEYSSLAGSGDSCCKMTLKFIDPDSSLFEKSFRLTLPELTGFPDFLVAKTRYDAAIQRNWTNRDKCRVWWKNDGEEDGSWWDGRVISVQPKSSEFPSSPWETCSIRYKSVPPETHLHSPWELFDADTQWEQPRIDDETRDKLLSAIAKLDQSAKKAQDYYGVHKLRQVSQKSSYTNRFPVPLSLDVIKLRLENHYYRSLNAVKHDFKVMLSNAESYFGKNAELSTKMRRLSNWLTRILSSL